VGVCQSDRLEFAGLRGSRMEQIYNVSVRAGPSNVVGSVSHCVRDTAVKLLNERRRIDATALVMTSEGHITRQEYVDERRQGKPTVPHRGDRNLHRFHRAASGPYCIEDCAMIIPVFFIIPLRAVMFFLIVISVIIGAISGLYVTQEFFDPVPEDTSAPVSGVEVQ